MKRILSFFMFLFIVLSLGSGATGCREDQSNQQALSAKGASQGTSTDITAGISKGTPTEVVTDNSKGASASVTTGTSAKNPEVASKNPWVDEKKANRPASTVTGEPASKVHLLLYLPDSTGKRLIATESYVAVEKSIEQTIVEQLLPRLGMGKAKVLSVTGKNGRLTVNLSKEFIEGLERLGEKRSAAVFALVNSLTQLNGVNEVRFTAGQPEQLGQIKLKSGTQNISLNNFLKRDRSWFHRDSSLSPADVMLQEMTYEQKGQWLKAYLMMSDDEKNPHRKYYDVFYKELEEMKDNGFLYTDFRINGYEIEKTGDKARVRVRFINRINNSYPQDGDNLYFNTVKIHGVWMVDWLTTQ